MPSTNEIHSHTDELQKEQERVSNLILSSQRARDRDALASTQQALASEAGDAATDAAAAAAAAAPGPADGIEPLETPLDRRQEMLYSNINCILTAQLAEVVAFVKAEPQNIGPQALHTEQWLRQIRAYEKRAEVAEDADPAGAGVQPVVGVRLQQGGSEKAASTAGHVVFKGTCCRLPCAVCPCCLPCTVCPVLFALELTPATRSSFFTGGFSGLTSLPAPSESFATVCNAVMRVLNDPEALPLLEASGDDGAKGTLLSQAVIKSGLVPTTYTVPAKASPGRADTVLAIVKNVLGSQSSAGLALIVNGADALSAGERDAVAAGLRAMAGEAALYQADLLVDPTPEAIAEAEAAGQEPPQPEIPPPEVVDRSSIVIFSCQAAVLPAEDMPIQRCSVAVDTAGASAAE